MEKSTIIFDGECNLCNGVVGWLLRETDLGIFNFVPFQSNQGQNLLEIHGFNTRELETVILLDDQGIHTLSDGFLKILAKIPTWYPFASILSYIPRFVRDSIYKGAAKNRVRWFGKSQVCTVSIS